MKNTKIIAVEAIEKSKNLNTVEKIIIELADAGISKDKIVGAIGGGLIQDLLTLSASIYKRGIQWIYFPTTLMAMADSCIGGKSSINVANFKNIVGNIYPPKNIIIDSIFIKTLNEESKISGLSEAIKICYAKGKNELDNFIDIYQKNELENQNYYLDLIFESLKAKKWFIEIDEFDQKERQLLNFGHSFAHALEAATDFKITHGVAVSVGMLAALNHPTAYVGESEVKLKRFIFDLLMPIKNYLQEIFLKIDWSIFISALKNDKKNSKNELVLILPRANNSLERVKFELNNENLDKAAKSLLQAIEDINNGN
jgi:3-dehydroquinate synthase